MPLEDVSKRLKFLILSTDYMGAPLGALQSS
jgi:hypothetical protein